MGSSSVRRRIAGGEGMAAKGERQQLMVDAIGHRI
jgi:hypothetical protein